MIREFLSYLELELNRSPLTVEAYALDLRQFSEYLGSVGDGVSIERAGTREIRGWLAAEARDGVNPRSLRRKTQSLRAFYRWLMKRGDISFNPASDITLAKTPKKLPEFVLPDRMEEILAAPFDREDGDGALSHLLLNLLYSTGIRQAELLALNDSDISFPAGEAKITGKRNKQRVVPLPPQLLAEIADWQRLRDSLYPPHPEGALFTTPRGRLTKGVLYRICRGILSTTGATRLGPHTLRHTFASAMVDAGADLNAVKEMLGHESLSTTQIYTHLSFNRLSADYLKAHPRSRKKDES